MSHFFISSNERRHVIAAFLSVDRPCSDFRSPEQAAWLLRYAGHDVILKAAFGKVPSGMRGALARTDTAVQPRRYYTYLKALLSASDGSLRRLIERLSIVSLAKLRAARALPADARRPGLVDRIVSLRDARDLKSFINLISTHGADRAAMISAFETHKRHMREVARHWSLKTSFPPHPIPRSATYLPISSGQELRDVAHKFRNCVRVYIADVLDNLVAFAIFELEGRDRAVVHLQRDSEGRWSLQGLHGPSNLVVSRELRARAEAHLETHGILVRRRPHAASKFDPVRRLSRYYSFADDED